MSVASTDDLLDDLRPRAFAIAYRMLGSVSEAEDVVQEALIRVHSAIERGEEISSPRAYAATITTRLAIDELRSARARRESYVGEWLPEPIAEPEEDPARQAEQADSLSLAFLVLLESLTPEQRAALLLHDVFDYGYSEVAEIVGTSEDSARQLASRARKPRPGGTAAVRALTLRSASGSLTASSPPPRTATSISSRPCSPRTWSSTVTGGLAPAIKHPVFGRAKVAQMLGNWWKLGEKLGATNYRRVLVNGQPGAEFLDADGRLISVLSLDIADGRIQALRSVVNPDKLRHLGEVADANELLREDQRVALSQARTSDAFRSGGNTG